MSSQQEKADRFRALHQQDHAFIIPNPWDVGTARLLARLGFEALATHQRRLCVLNAAGAMARSGATQTLAARRRAGVGHRSAGQRRS